MVDLILASASPRRAELLDQINVRYRAQAVDIDESCLADESAETLVKRLAKEKAEAILFADNEEKIPVLGSDTLGLLNGQLLVKPSNFDDAYQMLSSMSGTTHEILSAVAVSYMGETHIRLNRNQVRFRPISDAEIKAYWDTGEPQDKAGAYAVQGLGATFIERIEGSYSGIMGLPLFETCELLGKVGINILK